MSEEKPQDQVNWGELGAFVEKVLPQSLPLIENLFELKKIEASNKAEISRLQHAIASRQLIYEIIFLTAILVFTGLIIWVFIQNGSPDTAEKILFALLGFVGGRGFLRIGTNT